MQNTSKNIVFSGLMALWAGLSAACASVDTIKTPEEAERDPQQDVPISVIQIPPQASIRELPKIGGDAGAKALPVEPKPTISPSDLTIPSPGYPPELFTPPEVSPPPGQELASDESIVGGFCTDPIMLDTLVSRATYSEVNQEAMTGIADLLIVQENENAGDYLLAKKQRKKMLYEQVFSCNPENQTTYILAQSLLNERPINQDNFKKLYNQVVIDHFDEYDSAESSVSFDLMVRSVIEDRLNAQQRRGQGLYSGDQQVGILNDVYESLQLQDRSFKLMEIRRDLAEIFDNKSEVTNVSFELTNKINVIVDEAIAKQKQKAVFQKIGHEYEL